MTTTNTITPNTDPTTLIQALLAPASGINIQSAQLTSAGGSSNLYSGGLQGIGAGILLTSGYTPGTVNDSTSFGGDNGLAGSAALDAVVNTVFQTQSFNATELTFSFTVSDPAATSVSFDLVFGSEEYPEWVDAFVDVAVVMVNGTNVALFNHDPNHPLSVISPNLAAGYFVDNANGMLPTQYDGVSALLKFVAPIHTGVNTITIAIADTGDAILDSGIFVANLLAGTIPGSGVVSTSGTGTSGNDALTGTVKDEYFDLQAGDDVVYAGAGDDIVVAGSGNDTVYGGSGADNIKGDAGDDVLDGGTDIDTVVYAGVKADYNIGFDAPSGKYTVSAKANGAFAADGVDTLSNVEWVKFGDGSVWSLGINGVVSQSNTAPPATTNVNTPGTLFLSGIGGQGQTLTAKVSDVDGVPTTGITYAWQADGMDLGFSGNTFQISAAEVGKNITVTASYTDLSGNLESLVSTPKAIAAPGNGDFAITLLNLKTPVSASVMNPLTTLVENAIELGVSPNEAGLIIKKALGIDPKVDLQHYDAWAKLQTNPNDAAALVVEKKLVQVAVMTSLGSDETGMELTQAILLANSNNTTLNLADKTVIANLLGMASTDPLVQEIWDRNDTIDAAKAQGTATAVDAINKIWVDIQSGLSVTLSDTIGTLSVHINQAPMGFANATLADGVEGVAYTLNVADLLSGFTDPEGGVLTVANLAADHGTVTNGGSVFTITPDAAYSGPIELTYSVLDDQGLSAPAAQLLVIAPTPTPPTPVNAAPILNGAQAILVTGSEDLAYAVTASDLLQGFSDIDGDTLSVFNLSADHGTVTDNGNGSFTITPAANYYGTVQLAYAVSDGQASVTATQGFNLAAVNDAPTGSATASLTAGSEDLAYTVTASDLLQGFSDVDGDTLSVLNLSADHGTVTDNGNGSFTIAPAANYYGTVQLAYTVSDGQASVTATQGFNLAAVNDAPQALADAATTQAATLVLVDVLANDSDIDNAGMAAANAGLSIKAGSPSVAPGQGTVQIAGTQLAFTPAANFSGVASISYIATDGMADSAVTQVSVTVLPAPVVPPATPGTILGTAGNDKLTGTSGNDSIDGGTGADTMSGGLGDDTYIVDNTSDQVRELAGQGSDTVKSSVDFELPKYVENLTLTGSADLHGKGNDLANVLIGNAGPNEMDGGNGNDTLVGGGGKDKLVGGGGADVFKFVSVSDSVTGPGRDVIEDFKVGVDRMDVSEMDAIAGTAANDAFVFITTGFTHVAGQLRFDASKGILAGDVNGDGLADFEIALPGVSSLNVDSLIL